MSKNNRSPSWRTEEVRNAGNKTLDNINIYRTTAEKNPSKKDQGAKRIISEIQEIGNVNKK